jgi:hypothetical protein
VDGRSVEQSYADVDWFVAFGESSIKFIIHFVAWKMEFARIGHDFYRRWLVFCGEWKWAGLSSSLMCPKQSDL